MLREWRTRRRLTQLAERLEVPFRERNQMLLAAGHAPVLPERPLEDPEMAPVREALDVILVGHKPNPAVVMPRPPGFCSTYP